ncbi:MFS general substrate transporter [Clavulina sp. PMI_390]|nr:MFS general substrate transporter [Clavulina sp. PMI_390]
MLTLFCFGEFIDILMSSTLFSAIPSLERDMNMSQGESGWAFASYSATFSAFMLISGRVSDIYSARWTFIAGAFAIGVFAIGSAVTTTKVPFYVLRAFSGIGAGMNVPSALTLIVEWFPEPEEQAMALALFGSGVGFGNVLGVIFGAEFIEHQTWKWILYFLGIFSLTVAAFALLIVPPSAPRIKPSWRALDIAGVSTITTALILFVYAVTTAPLDGWGEAKVIAPLIICAFLAAGFFIYEARIPEQYAALPPKIWKYENVPILICLAFVPFLWWSNVYFEITPLFMGPYGWSPIGSSLRFLPIGLFSILIAVTTPELVKNWSPKWTIMFGLVLQFISSILLVYADSGDKYWSRYFPSFMLGTAGCMLVYTNASIALFASIPPEIAGVVGAVFNSVFQLGSALGIPIISTITQTINKQKIEKGEDPGYQGLADGWWFMVALVALSFIGTVFFYKVEDRTAVGWAGKKSEEETVVGTPETRSSNKEIV